MITEFVDDTTRLCPRGWHVVWVDIEHGGGLLGLAMRSPLTGAWLVERTGPEPTGSARAQTLRGARAFVVTGNGKRYGGHTSIGTVLTVA